MSRATHAQKPPVDFTAALVRAMDLVTFCGLGEEQGTPACPAFERRWRAVGPRSRLEDWARTGWHPFPSDRPCSAASFRMTRQFGNSASLMRQDYDQARDH